MTQYVHTLANEPTLGLYHVQEHIRRAVPKCVDIKVASPLPFSLPPSRIHIYTYSLCLSLSLSLSPLRPLGARMKFAAVLEAAVLSQDLESRKTFLACTAAEDQVWLLHV